MEGTKPSVDCKDIDYLRRRLSPHCHDETWFPVGSRQNFVHPTILLLSTLDPVISDLRQHVSRAQMYQQGRTQSPPR